MLSRPAWVCPVPGPEHSRLQPGHRHPYTASEHRWGWAFSLASPSLAWSLTAGSVLCGVQVLREHTLKPGHEFLNSKRRAKIAELVEKYVARGPG
jgi:hypothetical protein